LVFAHTDVDATGKSYYGETFLYYLSITGNFDCRVELNKPGPIHDVSWSPNAKEFIVVYGSMPAKATLFDHRAEPMYELGTGARNTVKYSPTGRFFFLGGFGNLSGEMVRALSNVRMFGSVKDLKRYLVYQLATHLPMNGAQMEDI
jgi:translation initiation factor 2A